MNLYLYIEWHFLQFAICKTIWEQNIWEQESHHEFRELEFIVNGFQVTSDMF